MNNARTNQTSFMFNERHLITNLIGFEFQTLQPGFEWPFHLHHFYQLDVVRSGEVTLQLEKGCRVRAKKGDGLFIPPLTWHGFRSREGYLNCTFKIEIAPSYWRQFGYAPLKKRLPKILLDLVEYAGKQYDLQHSFARQAIIAVASLCLGQVREGPDKAVAADAQDVFRQALRRLLADIQTAPDSQWSVSKMANACHMSPDYFTRCFQHVIGQRPHEYLLKAKFNLIASRLIEGTGISIKELSDQAGYASVHSFTRAFKHVIGVSPAEYRHMPIRF